MSYNIRNKGEIKQVLRYIEDSDLNDDYYKGIYNRLSSVLNNSEVDDDEISSSYKSGLNDSDLWLEGYLVNLI